MMHTAEVTTSGEGAAGNRLQRRKQRTRAALVKAAQRLIAEGKVNVPVLEITQAADVGMGSFYNHFDSKEQLFEAAVADVLDAHGALLDRLTASIEDPAETFATSFRLTGRLFRQRPQESEILLANGSALLSSERGLAPRALRDIKAAAERREVPGRRPGTRACHGRRRVVGTRHTVAGRPRSRRRARRRYGDRKCVASIRAQRRRGACHLSAPAA